MLYKAGPMGKSCQGINLVTTQATTHKSGLKQGSFKAAANKHNHTLMCWYPWYLAGGETQSCRCDIRCYTPIGWCLHLTQLPSIFCPWHQLQMYEALVPTDDQIFSLFTMATNSVFANTIIGRYDTINMGGQVHHYIRSDIQPWEK